jgi:hypothetical protein
MLAQIALLACCCALAGAALAFDNGQYDFREGAYWVPIEGQCGRGMRAKAIVPRVAGMTIALCNDTLAKTSTGESP